VHVRAGRRNACGTSCKCPLSCLSALGSVPVSSYMAVLHTDGQTRWRQSTHNLRYEHSRKKIKGRKKEEDKENQKTTATNLVMLFPRTVPTAICDGSIIKGHKTNVIGFHFSFILEQTNCTWHKPAYIILPPNHRMVNAKLGDDLPCVSSFPLPSCGPVLSIQCHVSCSLHATRKSTSRSFGRTNTLSH
jgi:hypothetical protein